MEWTDFKKATYHEDQIEAIVKNLQDEGVDDTIIRREIDRLTENDVYVNNLYQVAVDRMEAGDEMPDHYNPQREELGRLYVGKDRDGGPGWVPLEFHAEQTAFVDPNDPQNEATKANPEPVF